MPTEKQSGMQLEMKKNKGMTLIEVLVVIAILGIFMAIAVPGVTKSFRAMSQAKRLTSRYPLVRKSLAEISTMLRKTYPTAVDSGAAFTGRNGSFEAGGIKLPSDELSFPVLDTKYAHLQSVQIMSYRLELDPKEENSMRGLIQTRLFLDGAPEAGIKETILERAVGLDFSYLDESLDPPQWINEWPPTNMDETIPKASPQDARVPGAVKMTIFVLGEISPKPKSFTTVINIPSR